MKDIMLSICCITYNHELYIKEAIDSFLNQKVDFEYEIIIHDDASQDNTVNIIKEYEKKYPSIIKPIYQIENQYKKGKKASIIAMEKAKGKYIAFCEGDDYWIDDRKLQKQVDYMEKNPKCTFCFHNAKMVFMNNRKEKIFLNSKNSYEKNFLKKNDYDAGDIHLLGYGAIPTASFVFKKEFILNLPKWYYDAPCGDTPLKLYMTSKGYAHYIDEVMSVYRRDTGNSITDLWKKEQSISKTKAINHINNLIDLLNSFDEYTNFKYSEGLEISRKMYKVQLLIVNEEYKVLLKNKDLIKYYKLKYCDRYLIKLYLKLYFPIIYRILINIKEMVK